LDLTREQLEAAEACGCALLPATEAQVGRLTPQRRIFRLDGRPFVARRPDGFLETHATLARLTEDRLRTAPTPPPPRRGAPAAATEQTATADATRIRQPPSSHGPAGSADTPSPPPPPTAPGPDATAADGTHDAAAPATEAEPVPARGGGRGTVRDVRRRAGQPKPPRWTTAGALRRGRPPTPR
jgi:hypothetical protein